MIGTKITVWRKGKEIQLGDVEWILFGLKRWDFNGISWRWTSIFGGEFVSHRILPRNASDEHILFCS